MIKKRKSMREQVYEYLKNEIVTGNIEEGSRIVEEEYSKKLNVSRTPLREAIRMLELEGLIETREKGGVIVPKTTKEDIEEIVKIRVALETLIIEEIIKKITVKDREKLEKNLIKTESIIEDDTKVGDVFKYFSEFNRQLYEISKMPRVVTLIDNLNLYLKKFRRLSISNYERRKIAHQEHKQIVEFIKLGEQEKAIEINKKHLLESKEFLINQIKE